MKQFVRALFALAALVAFPAISFAMPLTYVGGSACPVTIGPGGNARQYQVTDAIACFYEAGVNSNIVGNAGEAAWLDAGPAIWGEDWVGLGQTGGNVNNPPALFAPNFTYTSLDGGTHGKFTIGAQWANQYDQFAVGIKDGGDPRWAIFLLSAGDLSSDWAFINGGGSLSHFTLYGHDVPGIDPRSVPDGGATLTMLGFAMAGLAYARQKFTT